jgi:hypothetical protein
MADVRDAATAKATDVTSAKATDATTAKAAHVAPPKAAHVAAAKPAHVSPATATTMSPPTAAAAGLCTGGKKAAGKHRTCQNHHHASSHDILHLDGRACRHRAFLRRRFSAR